MIAELPEVKFLQNTDTMKYIVLLTAIALTLSTSASEPTNPFGKEVGYCEKADEYQAAYLKSTRIMDLAYFTHYTSLCFGTPSMVNFDHCRTAQSYQDKYMRTYSVAALNSYTTYTSKCLYNQ